MKKNLFFIFFFLLPLTSTLLPLTAFALDWKEEKGDHFIIYYQTDQPFVKEVLRRAESYYNHIASDLGYARYSNFWQWENRVKIYIYSSKSDYEKISGQPGWSEGVADYTRHQIISYRQSENFLEGLLPHEIAHLVFRDFVGFKGQVPLWLDEGVAQWHEPKKRDLSKRIVLHLLQKKELIPLRDLTAVSDLTGKSDEKINFFYMQAVSVVDFLIKNYGTSSFTDFCRQLRDGKKLDDALRSAYAGSLNDIDELQDRWINFSKQE